MGLAFPRAASLLSIVERETGLDVRRAIERGGRALGRTEVLQPTLVAVAWACAEAMQAAGLRADRCLGHSLGAAEPHHLFRRPGGDRGLCARRPGRRAVRRGAGVHGGRPAGRTPAAAARRRHP